VSRKRSNQLSYGPAAGQQVSFYGEFPVLQNVTANPIEVPRLRSGFRHAAQTPRKATQVRVHSGLPIITAERRPRNALE
jgi:hypothetical protein